MRTICISIGNSDNKLSQQEWARFVKDVDSAIVDCSIQIHFFGGSITWATWQNVCWWIDIDENRLADFKDELTYLKRYYRQESIAFLSGNTEFL